MTNDGTIVSRSGRVAAFSLLELLVVIVIIALLAGLGTMVFQNAPGVQSVQGGVNIAAQLAGLARGTASLNGRPTRLVIDVEEDSDYYLRRMAVLQELEDGTWQLVAKAEILPRDIYFYPEYSSGGQLMPFLFPAGESATQCFYYEYSSAGRLVAAPDGERAKLVFSAAPSDNLDGDRAGLSAGRNGFILRPTGGYTFFDSAEQIPPS